MIDLSNFIYSPVIRTRRAELLGFSELSKIQDSGLLPIFELTRSRRTKSNPEGSVEVSVENLADIVKDANFVVDVTSLSALTNSEVERLLDPERNFGNWVEFVSKRLPKSALPMVHLTDPFDPTSVVSQLDHFIGTYAGVAFRVPSEFAELDELAKVVDGAIDNLDAVAIYADVGLVTERGYRGALARAFEVGSVFSDLEPGLLSVLASSFPSTVTPYGDVTGSFPLYEVQLSDAMIEEFSDLHCIHGDYACIHPMDLEGMAINWVPRVDVPLDDSLFYYRYRRNAGGYIKAAESALSDARYVPLSCWGNDNIRRAASGDPQGKAPAFWISVRLNFHIERQLARLGA